MKHNIKNCCCCYSFYQVVDSWCFWCQWARYTLTTSQIISKSCYQKMLLLHLPINFLQFISWSCWHERALGPLVDGSHRSPAHWNWIRCRQQAFACWCCSVQHLRWGSFLLSLFLLAQRLTHMLLFFHWLRRLKRKSALRRLLPGAANLLVTKLKWMPLWPTTPRFPRPLLR